MRLSKGLKSNIIDTESSKIFDSKIYELEEQLLNLFKFEITAKAKELENLIGADKLEYLKLNNYLYINNEIRFRSNTNQKQYYKLEDYYPSPYGYNFEIQETEPHTKIINAIEDLTKKQKEFERSLSAILDSYSDSKKLVAVMPSLAKYFIENEKIFMPIPLNEINKINEIISSKEVE